jgi:hypothetical protein
MARRALAIAMLLAALAPARPLHADEPAPLPPPRHVPGGPGSGTGVPAPKAPSAVDAAPPLPSPEDAAPRPPPSRALAPPVAPGRSDGRALPPLPEEPVDLFVDPRVGRLTPFAVDESTLAVVMTGNPRITSGQFSIKGRTIVVWIDRGKAPSLAGFAVPIPGVATEAEIAPAPTTSPARRSLIPEAIVGLFAEGAIEIVTGGFTFRAEEAYIDGRTDRALIIQPRFETTIATRNVEIPVPLFVRAQQARVVASGRGVFENAEATTSRANDRIALEVRTLTIEDLGTGAPGEPLILGFRPPDPGSVGKTFGSQRYSAVGISGQAERLRFFYWPRASFGGTGGREFPMRLRRASVGSRSSFGYWGFVGVGGEIGEGEDPPVNWLVDIGGYTKRGPAIRGDVDWRHRGLSGRFQPFLVHDATGNDRDDFQADEGLRYRLALENRWDATKNLRFDLEANEFSDGGVNREFFESDDRNHKDRESYARARWMRGGLAATATYGAHLREFETETIREPELALWTESVPLVRLSPRVGIDLSTEASTGRLRRRFEDDDPQEDYSAWRTNVATRLHMPFDVGDVRVSPYAGVHWTSWTDRDDEGDDLSRTAFEAGVRANLQLHREYGFVGGCFDGLRHVIDLDVGAYGRYFDDTDVSEVPFFDRIDEVEDRTQIDLQVRNRLETRRIVPGPRPTRKNATLADVLLRVSLWPEEKGPYLQRGTGEAEVRWMAEVLPDRMWLRGEASTSLDGPRIQHASSGIAWTPTLDLRAAAGVRFVQDETLGPWAELYWRYSEKWALRTSGFYDFEKSASQRYRISVLRFSDDHFFELGVTVRDGWDDLSIVFNFLPAIGGVPLTDPFDLNDNLDYTP